jgi:hypothetical protein
VALQGTLETFSVPEVLRLLAGTNKTGLLALEGDRGVGNVWLTDGRISTAQSEHEQGDRIEAVLFDLLRFSTGSFVFEPGARPDEDGVHEADVEEVLTEAERLLVEWREIEAVVPSLDVRVHLVDELSGESVTVTADQWRSLALIGSGITARRIGARLDLGEFDACSLVRDLVDAGLVDVTEDLTDDVAEEEPAAAAATVSADEDRLVDHDLSHDEVASLGQNLAGFVAGTTDDQSGEQFESDDDDAMTDEPPGAHELTDVAPFAEDELVDVSASTVDAFGDDVEPADDAADDIEPEDFLSQLSNLSPKAAAAIEATAETADDNGDAAPSASESPLAAVSDVDGDEEINRNLLLKFLSSAKN